jgi:hypothetical protein
MGTKFDWQKAYEDAVLEVDNSKLTAKANLAEEAIFARLRTLPFGEDRERVAIQKAITALHILRRERLGSGNSRRPSPSL